MPNIAKFVESLKDENEPLLNKETQNQVAAFFQSYPTLKKLDKNDSSFELPCSVIRTIRKTAFAIYNPDKSKKCIVSGNEGSIKIAQNLDSGSFCLVKIRKNINESNKLFLESQNEIKASFLFRTNYILDYQELSHDGIPHKTYTFMNALPGEPLSEINSTLFSNDQCLIIILNLLTNLQKLGVTGIHHNDLNYENILLDDQLNIHLIDFGQANYNNTRGLIYGYDFDAIYEIIEELELVRGDKQLQTLLDSTLEEAGNYDSGFNEIKIDPLLIYVKRKIYRQESRDQSELEDSNKRFTKRFRS